MVYKSNTAKGNQGVKKYLKGYQTSVHHTSLQLGQTMNFNDRKAEQEYML